MAAWSIQRRRLSLLRSEGRLLFSTVVALQRRQRDAEKPNPA